MTNGTVPHFHTMKSNGDKDFRNKISVIFITAIVFNADSFEKKKQEVEFLNAMASEQIVGHISVKVSYLKLKDDSTTTTSLASCPVIEVLYSRNSQIKAPIIRHSSPSS